MNPPLPLFGKGENGGILGLFPAETIIDSIFITVKTFHGGIEQASLFP